MSKRKQASKFSLTCADMLEVMRKDRASDDVHELVREFLAMSEDDRLFLTATLLMRLTLGDVSRMIETSHIESLIASMESEMATKQ